MVELFWSCFHRLALQLLILFLQLFLFLFCHLILLFVLIDDFLDGFWLPRIADGAITDIFLNSFFLVNDLNINLFIFELVAFLHEFVDGLVGCLQLIFIICDVFVFDEVIEFLIEAGELLCLFLESVVPVLKLFSLFTFLLESSEGLLVHLV